MTSVESTFKTDDAADPAAIQKAETIPVLAYGREGAQPSGVRNSFRRSLPARPVLDALRFLDALTIGLSGVVGFQLSGADTGHSNATLLAIALVAGSVLVLSVAGDYAAARRALSRAGFARLLSGVTIAICLVAVCLFVAGEWHASVSWWLLAWLTVSFGGLASTRLLLWAAVRRSKYFGKFGRRIAVFGAGPEGSRVVHHLLQEKSEECQLIAVVDDKPRIADQIEGVPVFGGVRSLSGIIEELRCDELIIALPWSALHRSKELCEAIQHLPLRIRLAALDASGVSGAEMPLVDVLEPPLSEWQLVRKRLFDLIAASALLVFLLPVLAAIALAIKIDSPGPVLFRQRREGMANKAISVFKFRTMYHDQSDPTCRQQSSATDPRVTRVGQFLRRTGLDELPQLLNVVSGEMSLVGPRPHAIAMRTAGYSSAELIPAYGRRQTMRPGITGWAQIHGSRGPVETPEMLRERVAYDLHYIDNWSDVVDLKIIAITVLHLVRDLRKRDRLASTPPLGGSRRSESRRTVVQTRFVETRDTAMAGSRLRGVTSSRAGADD